MAFPADVAVMEHVPVPIMVTVEPDTVQTPSVVEVKETGNPEDAVALMINGGAATVTSLSAPKEIVVVAEKVQMPDSHVTGTITPAATTLPV